MNEALPDLMELNRMTRKQLVQLCTMLYELLKERTVTVNLNQPFPFTNAVPMPYTNPNPGWPLGPTITCNAAGQEAR